ncbi:MAG: DUF2796 domain-containing protein [Anaerolineaceae bacterium]|nr:MAG: DUF2796 domain-containing protein [Anaerolineaceae bacterium]
MFRYLLIIGLLLVFAVSCSPTTSETTESQNAATEETAAEEPSHEESRDDEHDDDHEDDHEQEENVEDDDHRDHGAHEHGAAILTIAWSGNDLAIDLQTPAYNVLGFEYAPSSDAEKALLDESVVALESGDLLQLSSEANCSFISAVVQTELAEEAHEDGEEHEEEEETHSDIDVAYAVQCQNPDKLESVDASELFVHFPNFEALQVQWVSDTNQSAGDLTAEEPTLSFK